MKMRLTPRPSREEAAKLFPGFTPKELNLLLQVLDAPRTGNMGTRHLLGIGLVDWCRAAARLDATDAQRAVLGQRETLDAYADGFDSTELVLDARTRPSGHLVVMDRRFVGVTTGPTVFDLTVDAVVDAPPHAHMTTVTCDLGVMLLHLLGKLVRLRKETDHDRTEQRPGGPDQRGPAGGPGPAHAAQG